MGKIKMDLNKPIGDSVDEMLDDYFIKDAECKRLSEEIAMAQDELERALLCSEKLERYAELLHQRAARMVQIAYMRGKTDVKEFLYSALHIWLS